MKSLSHVILNLTTGYITSDSFPIIAETERQYIVDHHLFGVLAINKELDTLLGHGKVGDTQNMGEFLVLWSLKDVDEALEDVYSAYAMLNKGE